MQLFGITDTDHQVRMRQIELNHQKAMKSIQTQSELESAQHQAIMIRIKQLDATVGDLGKLDAVYK